MLAAIRTILILVFLMAASATIVTAIRPFLLGRKNLTEFFKVERIILV